ncbi:MAG: AMP-binding protein, partial [Candidatus Nanopelagicales bacterium]
MAKQPWIAKYPEGVSPYLAQTDIAHLPDLIRRASKTYPGNTAFTQCMSNGMHGSLTFKQIDSQAKVLVIIDMFADRLPEVLQKTNIETVITIKISEYFPAVAGSIIRVVQKYVKKDLPKITFKHTKLAQALSQGHSHSKRSQVMDYEKDINSDSIAALQYTGGTTGVSKGAMLSHKNLVLNTLQMMQMVDKFIRMGKETIITALPLYHIFAFTVNLLGFYH